VKEDVVVDVSVERGEIMISGDLGESSGGGREREGVAGGIGRAAGPDAEALVRGRGERVGVESRQQRLHQLILAAGFRERRQIEILHVLTIM
jgi:hypothetical protein